MSLLSPFMRPPTNHLKEGIFCFKVNKQCWHSLGCCKCGLFWRQIHEPPANHLQELMFYIKSHRLRSYICFKYASSEFEFIDSALTNEFS